MKEQNMRPYYRTAITVVKYLPTNKLSKRLIVKLPRHFAVSVTSQSLERELKCGAGFRRYDLLMFELKFFQIFSQALHGLNLFHAVKSNLVFLFMKIDIAFLKLINLI